MHPYETELEAIATIYKALTSFPPEDRGRILEQVQARFARERVPGRLRPVEHIVIEDVPAA
jgi:hypothetical protein